MQAQVQIAKVGTFVPNFAFVGNSDTLAIFHPGWNSDFEMLGPPFVAAAFTFVTSAFCDFAVPVTFITSTDTLHLAENCAASRFNLPAAMTFRTSGNFTSRFRARTLAVLASILFFQRNFFFCAKHRFVKR